MPKNGKNRTDTSWTFDALTVEAFDGLASVGSSAVSTTIQSYLPIPQRFKIAKIGVSYTGATTASFNIVVGVGAESGCNTVKDALAVANNTVFAADQALVSGNTNIVNIFIPTQPDTIYDLGSTSATSQCLLTLRAVTGGAGGINNFKVSLIIALLDARTNDSGGVPGTNW